MASNKIFSIIRRCCVCFIMLTTVCHGNKIIVESSSSPKEEEQKQDTETLSSSSCSTSPPDVQSSIPIIDISPLLLPNQKKAFQQQQEQEKLDVIAQIRTSCEEIGFFAIINHGVHPDVIATAWNITREFFDLPSKEKEEVVPNGFDYPYGYEQSETLSSGKQKTTQIDDDDDDGASNAAKDDGTTKDSPPPPSAPDLKETFSIGPLDPTLSGMPPRKFPSHDGMQTAYESYYKGMEGLSMTLLKAFALALDLEEDWFTDKMDRHMSALRTLNYPELDADHTPLPGQLRAGAHTDYGALTILKSGGPGLQVRKDDDDGEEDSSSSSWVDVPFLPDAFIVNIGDLMQRWTNDKWKSTLHRVVITSSSPTSKETSTPITERRQSMAFFVNINGDAKVQTIPSCMPTAVDNDGTTTTSSSSKYKPILAKDYLKMKHLASMGVVDTEEEE